MRVARILVGIVLVAIAVLANLCGGAMWTATQHESADGSFGGASVGTHFLLWPLRRRDIVYVVEPSQLPDVAERLGMTIVASPTASPNALSFASAAGDSQESSRLSALPEPLPAEVIAALAVHDGAESHPFAALSATARAARRAGVAAPAAAAHAAAAPTATARAKARASVPKASRRRKRCRRFFGSVAAAALVAYRDVAGA